MAEWVLAGNLKGPQGEPGQDGQDGQDATLPTGGTTGQVLTKTADGEEWADLPSIPNPLPISQGGTGATTLEGAKTALGIDAIEQQLDGLETLLAAI